jgi:uncharacterized YceG family protein
VVERRAHLRCLAGVLAGVALAAAGCSGEKKQAAAPPPPPPPPKPLRIIFPEGFTRRDMAARITAVDAIARTKRHVRPKLSARAYLRLTSGNVRVRGFGRKAHEGFLFPATYDFFERTSTKTLVRDQLETFEENWSKVNFRYARKKNLTPYDVLIIASMVEKEAQAPRERPLVAAVIYNRLHNRIPLGMDSTIRYALNVPPTESLRESELNDPTPYNTRLHTGLPPTPIANPGLASIKAAAHPAKVDYLYFVRKPDHVHHFFTSSYRDFQNYANAHGY